MRRFGILVTIFVMLSGLALAQGKGGTVSTAHDPSSENAVELLRGAERVKWQQPQQVFGLLSVQEGETVADLGAGLGFFSAPLSNIVGADGKVFAVEFDPGLIEQLQVSEATNAHANTAIVLGSETDPKLPAGIFDLVLTVNTWHRLGDRGPMLEAVGRALKTGGRFVVIDWHQGDIPIAPPVERRLPRQELIEEMKAAGWTLTSLSRMLEYQYVAIFIPPAP